MSSWATAQVGTPGVINREYAIKAAFLYHFSTYVEWPPEDFPADGEPFVIGVYRSDPFGGALAQIARSKKVAGREIVVRLIQSPESVDGCQILFVPESVPAEEQIALLRELRGKAVFLVGESPDFVVRGGDVQFYVENNKVRFAFAAGAAKRQDLKVSSKLLSLAKIVPTR